MSEEDGKGFTVVVGGGVVDVVVIDVEFVAFAAAPVNSVFLDVESDEFIGSAEGFRVVLVAFRVVGVGC